MIQIRGHLPQMLRQVPVMSGRKTPVASGKQVKSRIGKAAGEKTGEKAGEKPRKVQPGSRREKERG